jgi:WD40 repeat protein
MEIVQEKIQNSKLNDAEISYLIWNCKQIKPIQTFKDNLLGVADFSQNNLQPSEVTTVSFDQSIRVYDIEKMKNIKTFEEHTAGVWTIDYANKSELFLTGGNDNQIILWDSKSHKPVSRNSHHSNTVYDVQFSTNDNLFASCSKGEICIWDLKKLESPLQTIKGRLLIIII